MCISLILALATSSKDDIQCALQIISLASECGMDNLARSSLLKSVADMPEGVEVVKWLYTILVKSMSKNKLNMCQLPTSHTVHAMC